MAETQNFENHAKFVPGYHFVTFGIFAINFFWRIYQLVHAPSGEAAVNLLLAIGLVLTLLYARIFALKVQDRVIRLEMRLRMQRLLPADLQSRVGELSVNQLVSLRFASDQELPELARKVLEGKIEDRKTIKKMVKKWEPDFLRA
jgi:hypothetical protein